MTVRKLINASFAIILIVSLLIFSIFYINNKKDLKRIEDIHTSTVLSNIEYYYESFDMYINNIIDYKINPKAKNYSKLIYKYIKSNPNNINSYEIKKKFNINDFDVSIIDKNGIIIDTTIKKDLGLNLFNKHENLESSLKSLLKNGGFLSPGIDSRILGYENKPWIFTYYSKKDFDYIIELGVRPEDIKDILSYIDKLNNSYNNNIGDGNYSIYRNDIGIIAGETIQLDDGIMSKISKSLSENKRVVYNIDKDDVNYRRDIIPTNSPNLYNRKDAIILTSINPVDHFKYFNYTVFFIIFFILTLIVINYLLNERLLRPLESLNSFVENMSTNNFQSISFNNNLINNENKSVKELINFKYKLFELLEDIQADEEEITLQNEKLNRSNKEIKIISHKLEEIMDSFTNVYKLNKDDFIKKSFDSIFNVIKEADKGTLFELKDGYYYPIASKGYDKRTIKNLKFKKGETFIDLKDIKDNKIEAFIERIDNNNYNKFKEDTSKVLKKLGTDIAFDTLYAPIIAEKQIIGMISLDSFSNPSFNEDSQKILRYYAQLISEFYNQSLKQEEISNTYLEIVKALVSAIELKDSYTKGHGDRVRNYSVKIAKAMNLNEDKIKNIDIAALLHDIGKIGIPERILNKSGKLDEDEYELIKKHPEFSKKIVEQISGLSEISYIIHLHHEFYNGEGYPFGLKKDEIPIESQIIQVADAFDAMTSDRSYRKAMSNKKAIDIIDREKGKQFNPKIADVAIEKVFNNI